MLLFRRVTRVREMSVCHNMDTSEIAVSKINSTKIDSTEIGSAEISTDSSAETTSKPKQNLSRRRFLLRSLAVAGALSVCDLAYETDMLTVTRHNIRMAGLKQPCRLVQLSDLHRSWCVSQNFIEQVVRRTNALKPDVIALTGDFVTHSTKYMSSCAEALKSLQAPLGLYGVLGNHDAAADGCKGRPRVIEGLTAINVQLLANSSARLENGLRLVGVDDALTATPDPVTAFGRVDKNEAMIAMTHNPRIFPIMCQYDCVTIAGHTHGGQINISGLTSHLLGARLRYQRGWYREPTGPGRLYVTRGLGVVGMPFRFHSPPEITVFDLIPA